ncbi:MAG: hypothetical protein EOQ42_07805 [Mesorhizobium sp.]|uniref:hypothetical protein n=1 Tax=Mesorhizobium sp. TaxID=1871066 RepID=UPI000FE93237|nr:hypothetical protein [Mesorhizobium sp.]RWB79329.1 MAG: hypothetical protein EOQ42_07805 [Mesorhizobium sp.]TIU75642.1 MAG: hypothetical protein E5W13_19875 [Mesorhizobium sp.]TIX04509.1 MAG: hypothetical protein E5V57_14465 [Mesorhizobium sp.]
MAAERSVYTLDFSFGFRFDPALCCICEGHPEHLADKPPGCASVKAYLKANRQRLIDLGM